MKKAACLMWTQARTGAWLPLPLEAPWCKVHCKCLNSKAFLQGKFLCTMMNMANVILFNCVHSSISRQDYTSCRRLPECCSSTTRLQYSQQAAHKLPATSGDWILSPGFRWHVHTCVTLTGTHLQIAHFYRPLLYIAPSTNCWQLWPGLKT